MQFEKISLAQWKKDFPIENFKEEDIEFFYDELELPTAATKGSMCHDFFIPYSIKLYPKRELIIPTGIRWNTMGDYSTGLSMYPRSGLGFKYGIHLKNTVGKIDPDYCEASNEGHILICLVNPSDEVVTIPRGKAFVQGEINPFIILDKTDNQRVGGFGSSDKENK